MRIVSILTASVAALALISCGSGSETGAPKGDPVAAVAPPAGKQWTDVVTKTEGGGFLVGNPEAKVKLMEFASLTCHVCADFSTQSADELDEKYINTGKVSVEFRNFIRDPYDLMAARIIQCGAKEAVMPLSKQFYAWQPTLLEKGQTMGEDKLKEFEALPEETRNYAVAEYLGIIDFFAERGVSRDQAKTCLADKPAMDKLAKQTADYGKEYDIKGTPTFYLNGVRIDATAWPQVKGKLQEAGAR
jgi:protein-disulfide isomerase